MPGKPMWKPERSTLTRAQCVQVVYDREDMRCQRCGLPARKPSECGWEFDPLMAHVNELVPRSEGGDPCDPANCELIHHRCHFVGFAHAPTKARMERLQALAAKAKRLKQEAKA